MANKRALKRDINQICEELLIECIAASHYGHNREGAQTLLFCIIKIQDDHIRRISHPEPGMKASYYFKRLREDFVKQACEIIDQINNMY